MMSIIAATWFSPPSPARRFISLYSPETPLNRYLEHIRGIYTAPGTPASSGHSISLQPPFPPLSYVRAIYPVSTCTSLTKSEVASTRHSSSSKSSRRRAAGGRSDPLSLSLRLFYCVVARSAINSRGFTVPWKNAKHPPANIIHGTRPLFRRVTLPVCGRIAATREFNG